MNHTTVIRHQVHYPEGHGAEPISEQFEDIFICPACSDGLAEWVNCREATWVDPIDTLRALADADDIGPEWAERVIHVVNSIEGENT